MRLYASQLSIPARHTNLSLSVNVSLERQSRRKGYLKSVGSSKRPKLSELRRRVRERVKKLHGNNDRMTQPGSKRTGFQKRSGLQQRSEHKKLKRRDSDRQTRSGKTRATAAAGN